MKQPYLFLFISFLLFQCDPPHADLTEYQKEKESRKIQRISKGDLMTLASKKAALIVEQLNFKTNIDSLAIANNLVIQQIGIEDSSDILKENMIMDAYEYNVIKGLPLRDNEQLIENTYLLNRPIVSNDSLKGMWSIRINLFDLVK